MTHDDMLRFSKYRDGSAGSQQLALAVAQFVQERYGLAPSATADNEYLLYEGNFLLIQTIHQRTTSITLNLYGPPDAYADLVGPHARVTGGQAGYSKLYLTSDDCLEEAIAAIERSWQRRNPHEQNAAGAGVAGSPRYWLTTHWPLIQSNSDVHHRNIYLQEGHQSVGSQMRPGDKVLIYESVTGPTLVERLPDGTDCPMPRHVGRRGIVTVADVAHGFTRRPPQEAIEQYVDGTQMNWAWRATTTSHASNGFAPKAEVLRVLGYNPGYTMRGFGQMNSGLREIRKSDYEELLGIFVRHPRARGAAPGGKEPPHGPGGGEGPEHRLLKEYVAAHPGKVMGEEGITTLRMEYPFPSCDRADVVLRDAAGRYLGVEVEISQGDSQIEGLLQAIKYRHMLAVTEGVTFEECRAVLVAYRLSTGIRSLCAQYEVQPIEIARAAVQAWTAQRPAH